MAPVDTNQFKGLLDSARSVAILLPQNPGYDAVAAALALKLSLDQFGKPASVTCADPMTVEFHRLVGADTVISNFGSRNLVITFPGQTEIVDKVSYHLDDRGELNLVITPKPNTPGLDHRKLNFISGGAQADLIILVAGAEVPEVFAQTKHFSLAGSEEVTRLLETLKLPISNDAASNLLAGLEKSTSNFTANVTADTFEIAAVLMRQGARRHDGFTPEPSNSQITNNQEPTNPSPDWYTPKVFSGTTVS
ncbi:MAG: hypothetical protein UX99_C0013G0022 [Candidatus Amesbacteria bacterium GW2011_GWB1_47_26]|uniref:Phosphoesterase RecJ domain protein n=1 Tax=Candidatus Amesbacteria bacterium GW2011_GWC2_45_19 TaxID=1618366 RepID=A0A0G1Q313_9BACT|nr:MAG: hypothetical protein UX05_C0004G0074 [Candidatus Amesbacteria bacterium GW2011_GWC2_45_19]KKU38732.1 MAG: hypothetical protein UX52_C0001G0014 [Candidatus Amesbacteria bacterium GW2011_GWA1_46_35]KKU69235.1 MAG: hypothetical protein UX93_C0002G0074 [Microgenomates group bacterium GW2011_GWC1_47_20]KKU74494.1 MAG: hypothetical protein UX99_C0013G0022 [Candidatus Amesbacteria bacterium GW2011_GWB1_47_26]